MNLLLQNRQKQRWEEKVQDAQERAVILQEEEQLLGQPPLPCSGALGCAGGAVAARHRGCHAGDGRGSNMGASLATLCRASCA